jgi:hypothetical protein
MSEMDSIEATNGNGMDQNMVDVNAMLDEHANSLLDDQQQNLVANGVPSDVQGNVPSDAQQQKLVSNEPLGQSTTNQNGKAAAKKEKIPLKTLLDSLGIGD